jgi:hypothetical protein
MEIKVWYGFISEKRVIRKWDTDLKSTQEKYGDPGEFRNSEIY